MFINFSFSIFPVKLEKWKKMALIRVIQKNGVLRLSRDPRHSFPAKL